MLFSSKLAGITALASLTLAQEQSAIAPEDSHVVKLSQDSFDSFQKENELFLAEFFAPWCGHCKTLAPHYVEAAKTLHEEYQIPIVQVDCTDNQELCMEQGIKGYPTLKVFKKNGEIVSDYQGQRSKDAIVQFMVKQSLPAVSEFTDLESLNEFLAKQKDNVIISQYFADKDSQQLNETFYNVAENLRDEYVFVNYLGDDEVKSYNISVLTPSQDPIAFEATVAEEATLKESSESLSDFIAIESKPYFGEIDGSSYELYMNADIPLAYFFYQSEEQREEYLPLFNKLGKQYRGKLNFAGLDASKYGKHAENLNLEEQFPLFAIHELESNLKFGPEQIPSEEFTEETVVELKESSIEEFVEKYLNKELSPIIKSEEIPEVQESNVIKIVGKSHDEIRFDENKDVLVKYYAPWCGHCKKMAPLYETLADIYALDEEAKEKVVIGKIDGTLNDVFGIEITGYPTLALYPAGDLSKEPIIYKGPRTLESFLQFIKENGAHGIDGAQILADNTPVEEFEEDIEEFEEDEEVPVQDEL